MTAQLYKNQLLEKGLVDTRASAITEAISELHKAFAACDLTNRNTVRELFGDLTVDKMITDFAKTEDLAKDIFDQDRKPLEDHIYTIVKERIEENIVMKTLDARVQDNLDEKLDKVDWSDYVDDYIRSKIDTFIEEPVSDEVQRILDNATVRFEL